MKTRHTDIPIDDDSRDSMNLVGNETRISTRSSSRALTSPRVILRQRVHQRSELDRYLDPRLVTRRSKRKKYSSYPDIEYAAAKRTKQSSSNSNQEKQEESVAVTRSPRLTITDQLASRRARHPDDGDDCSPPPPARRTRHEEVGECSPRHTRQGRQGRRLPNVLKRLKSDLGEGYVEDIIRYNSSSSSGKPYGLRRERQIVTRYEAPDFREVVHTRITTDDDDDDDDEDEVEEEEDEVEEVEEGGVDLDDSRRSSTRSYSLRRKPPKVVRYADNIYSGQSKPRGMYHRSYSPNREYHRQYGGVDRKGRRQAPRSRHRETSHRVRSRVARRARHQSTTSESESETEKDEAHFEKRKKKSMNQARSKCLPMNLAVEDIQKGLFRERLKAGASMADIDPMSLDRSTTFTSVGGLDEHIKSLREMVVFPMLYPEVFEKFDIAPPRGVIFYGSPGTGKTLVARALSNECSKDGQKISFFMRKGADCLSKWVGESERQLRLLFDQAYSMRPSIIFFDEIDGLAPVRSTRQEQIHSSIVSTLLALMDGLDSRGEVVVIGATNRLDAIDPALRRPGRFDREFHFPLPSAKARAEILGIHTTKWSPSPHPDLLAVLADRTAGFCGADLKALVTESALSALRRRYPQIYKSNKRLLLDASSISVRAQDFYQALLKIEPAQARSNDKTRAPLPQHFRPLLSNTVLQLVHHAVKIIPSLSPNLSALQMTSESVHLTPHVTGVSASAVETTELVAGEPEIYGNVSARNTSYSDISSFFSTLESYFSGVPSHRPRMLVTSHNKMVMSSFLHVFEGVPLHEVSLTTLHDPNYRTVEEAASRIVTSSAKKSPSFLYIPHLDLLESSCNISVCNVLYTLLSDIAPGAGVLVLATISSGPTLERGSMFRELFNTSETVSLLHPTPQSITNFFTPLLSTEIERNFNVTKLIDQSMEELEEAPPLQPKPLSEQEIVAIEKREDSTLRELRLFLRDIVNKLMKERKFYCFCKPVNLEEVHDYLEVVEEPMDLEKIRENIDRMEYETIKGFIDDVETISANAIEYNPPDDHTGRQIRHRAAELKDFLHSLLDAELDEEFATLCEEMKSAREQREQQRLSEVADNNQSPSKQTKKQRLSDVSTRSKRYSVNLEEESTSADINGFTATGSSLHFESVVEKIVEVVQNKPINDILHLYTLVSQLILKNRSNKAMTVDSLLENHINPMIESFASSD